MMMASSSRSMEYVMHNYNFTIWHVLGRAKWLAFGFAALYTFLAFVVQVLDIFKQSKDQTAAHSDCGVKACWLAVT